MFIQPCNGQLLVQYHENAPANLIKLPQGVTPPNARPYLQIVEVSDEEMVYSHGDCVWALQVNCNLVDEKLRLFLVPACAIMYRVSGDPTTALEIPNESFIRPL